MLEVFYFSLWSRRIDNH